MDNRRQWERNLHAFETIDWESIVNEGREKKRMSMLPGV
jgi:hypothetical protein